MAGIGQKIRDENGVVSATESSRAKGCVLDWAGDKVWENQAASHRSLGDNACLEALADFTSREVKALSPAVLIKVGDQRVKLVDEVWGAEDPIADTLAVLLIEELIVGVYAGVDEVLSHRAGLPGENIERVLTEPRVFHGEIQTASRGGARRHPLHGRVFQAD